MISANDLNEILEGTLKNKNTIPFETWRLLSENTPSKDNNFTVICGDNLNIQLEVQVREEEMELPDSYKMYKTEQIYKLSEILLKYQSITIHRTFVFIGNVINNRVAALPIPNNDQHYTFLYKTDILIARIITDILPDKNKIDVDSYLKEALMEGVIKLDV